jgi:hypothetical protein
MGNGARQTAAAVAYRPQVWVAIGFWVMTPIFGLMAFGLTLLDPAVDMSCTRQDAEVVCDVSTEGLIRPSVAHLANEALQTARIVLGPEPHDRSYNQVELRQGASIRVLAGYTTSTRGEAVREMNTFLHDSWARHVAVRIVGSEPTPWQRFGVFPFQLISLICLAGGIVTFVRKTTLTVVGDALKVRRSRWPRPSVVDRRPLRELSSVEVVSRIPEAYAPIVAALPWRNIYRLTALATRTPDGQEILLTDLCKRGRALHERLATTIRGWVADQGESSNRSS